MQVSQAGIRGVPPPVLVRFMHAIGDVGNITGPYREYLFYWKTTRNDVIDVISAALWPYLGDAKRAQLTRAAGEMSRSIPASRPFRSEETERAWAAGFFDGEGCLYLTRPQASSNWRGVSLYLPQASRDQIPDTLLRFHRAIGGVGTITGPHPPRSPWSRLPQYHWQTSGRHSASAVLRVLWPFLASVSRQRVIEAAPHLDAGVTEGTAVIG
jgi:hypothetical protein